MASTVVRNWSPANKAIVQQFAARRQLVEEGIAAFLRDHYAGPTLSVVGDVVRGGKRVRGILTLLICEALGGQPQRALAAAVAVELAHAASLAHDDVLDADLERRGQPAFHVHHDLATTFLVPHLLVPHAVLAARTYGPAAVEAILSAWAEVVEGQVEDYLPLYLGRDGELHEDWPAEGYWSIVDKKTAALFATAAALGALAAGADEHLTPARLYGAWLGKAFQVADDLTDLRPYLLRPWAAFLASGKASSARSLHLLHRLIADDGKQIITRAALARVRSLVYSNVKKCMIYATAFPVRACDELLAALPAFAVGGLYDELRIKMPAGWHPHWRSQPMDAAGGT